MSKKAKRSGYQRVNITLPNRVRVLGRRLAQVNRRAFSAQVAVLIEREYAVRFPETEAA